MPTIMHDAPQRKIVNVHILSYYTITVATYLERHKLLTDDEREQLPADAFEPVRYVNKTPL